MEQMDEIDVIMNLIKVKVRYKKRLLLPALNSLQLSQIMQKTHKNIANKKENSIEWFLCRK